MAQTQSLESYLGFSTIIGNWFLPVIVIMTSFVILKCLVDRQILQALVVMLIGSGLILGVSALSSNPTKDTKADSINTSKQNQKNEEALTNEINSILEQYIVTYPEVLSYDNVLRIGDSRLTDLTDRREITGSTLKALEKMETLLDDKFTERNTTTVNGSKTKQTGKIRTSKIIDGYLYLHISEGEYELNDKK